MTLEECVELLLFQVAVTDREDGPLVGLGIQRTLAVKPGVSLLALRAALLAPLRRLPGQDRAGGHDRHRHLQAHVVNGLLHVTAVLPPDGPRLVIDLAGVVLLKGLALLLVLDPALVQAPEGSASRTTSIFETSLSGLSEGLAGFGRLIRFIVARTPSMPSVWTPPVLALVSTWKRPSSSTCTRARRVSPSRISMLSPFTTG